MSNNEGDSSSVEEASPPTYSEAEVESMRQALEGLLPQIQQEATRQIGAKFVRAESASDFYQQTLVTALKAARSYRGTSNQELSAWLRQILLNHLRRSVHRAQSQVEQNDEAWESLIPSGDPSPSQLAQSAERQDLINRCLAKLTSMQQEVIRLRVEEKLTYEDVGERIGKSAEATRKIFLRSVLAFQKVFAEFA